MHDMHDDDARMPVHVVVPDEIAKFPTMENTNVVLIPKKGWQKEKLTIQKKWSAPEKEKKDAQ